MNMKLSTTTGANISPTPEMSQPVAATGQTLSSAVDASVTVEAGVYALTAAVGYALIGWATTDTAANILFVCPEDKTILIHIPIGTIHFHYKLVGTGAVAFLRKVQE
jgi:hypothetical protein